MANTMRKLKIYEIKHQTQSVYIGMETKMMKNIMNVQYCDYPLPYAQGFQDPGSNWMYAIIDLHDNIIFFLIIIFVVVTWFFISSLKGEDHLSYLHHGNLIELIWTITPAAILWAIGLPSLRQLYMMDEILDAELTIKAIGNQWYWSYEYMDYENSISYDSFQVDVDSQEIGDQRQLTVDNNQVLPVNTNIRIQVSSNDVIHSFAIPSLAQKCDAIPGRQNSIGVNITRPSHYYGQCSELCGILHGFMPISLQAVTIPSYINWLDSQSLLIIFVNQITWTMSLLMVLIHIGTFNILFIYHIYYPIYDHYLITISSYCHSI